jgi:hypothetical protein
LYRYRYRYRYSFPVCFYFSEVAEEVLGAAVCTSVSPLRFDRQALDPGGDAIAGLLGQRIEEVAQFGGKEAPSGGGHALREQTASIGAPGPRSPFCVPDASVACQRQRSLPRIAQFLHPGQVQ